MTEGLSDYVSMLGIFFIILAFKKKHSTGQQIVAVPTNKSYNQSKRISCQKEENVM